MQTTKKRERQYLWESITHLWKRNGECPKRSNVCSWYHPRDRPTSLYLFSSAVKKEQQQLFWCCLFFGVDFYTKSPGFFARQQNAWSELKWRRRWGWRGERWWGEKWWRSGRGRRWRSWGVVGVKFSWTVENWGRDCSSRVEKSDVFDFFLPVSSIHSVSRRRRRWSISLSEEKRRQSKFKET